MSREDLKRLNSVLNRFTKNNVQLRQTEKKQALELWQPIVEHIVDYVQRDARFAKIQIFRTGSYYERAKVGEPNEFDLMLVMDNLELDDAPYEDDEDDGMSEPPTGFTRVMLDRGDERLWKRENPSSMQAFEGFTRVMLDRGDERLWKRENPSSMQAFEGFTRVMLDRGDERLEKRENCVNSRGMLSASRVKSVFARLVREAISSVGFERHVAVTSQGPAVTLEITLMNRRISVDLTLTIKDKSWPEDADEWKRRARQGWPNQQLIKEICQDGCHLVTKQPKGSSLPEHEKGFLWRYSFSAAEKKLFLQGSHGEASSCRKQVLRILKALKEELNLQPLKSYHLKTMLLYECEAVPQPVRWSFDRLGERFIDLLQRLEDCLRQSRCPHYFIKDFNLFELFPPQRCSELARKVQQVKQNPEQVLSNLIG